jgi:hypothetical protein
MRPGQVLDLMNVSFAGQRLHLETPQDPVPVKKQEKYNLNRWAVTGRNDLAINTACWRIYESLRKRGEGAAADDGHWRELCYLWSSDFRTHITEKRWRGYRERLAQCEQELGLSPAGRVRSAVGSATATLPAGVKIDKGDRYLTLEVDGVVAKLNHRRGLAIDQLFFQQIADEFLVGTLHHGYYDDIALGADFYTGHLVLEAPAQPKVTDLNPVEAQALWNEEQQRLEAAGTVETRLGPIHKTVSLDRNGVVGIRYELGWETMPVGALRLGHVTLNPAAFLARDLYYETHNGGTSERYRVEGNRIEHGRSVSFLVSSGAALGITAGAIRIGDGRRALSIHVDKSIAALVGQVTYTPAGDSYFFRVSLSAAELDDTTRERPPREFPRVFEFTLRASTE